MVALAVMSSAAYASSAEKAPAEASTKMTTEHKAMVGTNLVKVTEEVKEIKDGNALRMICSYTLRVYNQSGQLTTTHNHSYELGDDFGDMSFDSCQDYFSHMRHSYMIIYRSAVYNVG